MATATQPNLRQARTAAILRAMCENDWRSHASMVVVPYGSNGDVRAIVTDDDNPAPNPVRLVWFGGDAFIVESQAGYDRWLEMFQNAGHRPEAIERLDDAAFVIHPGGTYTAATD